MLPLGYMRKRVASNSEWLKAKGVVDIYSVSNCLSNDFADYINYWRHNGYWLFDSPAVIDEISQTEHIDLTGTRLFYYEAYEFEYDEDKEQWVAFHPEPSFVTDVQVPANMKLEGFDVVTFSAHSNPECSPLSCCALAKDLAVNEHCLFRTFAEAKEAIDRGLFNNSEPGPYRILAVYAPEAGLPGTLRASLFDCPSP
jgi:hypothetical protein